MALRGMPRVGAAVTVAFLARRVPATIEDVDGDGHRLVVVTEEGETLSFKLNPATGQFAEQHGGSRARLLF
ncbi:MAG: hypothetical protein QOI19_2166 [Thermoleophilaceae bacterium]|jgi:hypothetical protein|nr:hypothetical protein [Thermoleophilaceae bacterium]